jgi:hypothetical protein
MKYSVIINSIKTVDELESAWSNEDLIELLKRLNYPDAKNVNANELKDFIMMAIADFEPREAAAILLDYKLAQMLTEGQIDNLSHDMMSDKVSENYTDLYTHKALFDVNQLLYKAYNGKFPAVKAILIDFEMTPEETDDSEISKELVLKAFRTSLSDQNLINRLFESQLDGNESFPEAEGIIWDFENLSNNKYRMSTSEKWIKETDFTKQEFNCEIALYVENSEEE